MKKGKRKRRARSHARESFVRGFVATALLGSLGTPGGLSRSSMRRALMGGMAVASGTLVAEALQERRYSRSLVALAAGAAAMAIIRRYPAPDEAAQGDESRGQEEEIQQVQG